MNIFNSEYFFLRKPNDGQFPSLVPDENSQERMYNYAELATDAAPLIFHNGWKEKDIKNGVKRKTPNILFAGNDIIVNSSIREKLLHLGLPNLSIHPAIYIDNDEKWREDYWNLGFTERFDCWDRTESEYDQTSPPIQLGGREFHEIYSFSLNKILMDRTPLNDRLLFKMGGSTSAMITCHKSLVALFSGAEQIGAHVINILDY